MTKDEALKLALEALEPLEFVGKRMDGGNPKIDEAIAAIKKAIKQPSWIGLTDEDFLEACQIAERGNYLVAFQRIQAKLRSKNESKN